jgi:hypothetical protein
VGVDWIRVAQVGIEWSAVQCKAPAKGLPEGRYVGFSLHSPVRMTSEWLISLRAQCVSNGRQSVTPPAASVP